MKNVNVAALGTFVISLLAVATTAQANFIDDMFSITVDTGLQAEIPGKASIAIRDAYQGNVCYAVVDAAEGKKNSVAATAVIRLSCVADVKVTPKAQRQGYSWTGVHFSYGLYSGFREQIPNKILVVMNDSQANTCYALVDAKYSEGDRSHIPESAIFNLSCVAVH